MSLCQDIGVLYLDFAGLGKLNCVVHEINENLLHASHIPPQNRQPWCRHIVLQLFSDRFVIQCELFSFLEVAQLVTSHDLLSIALWCEAQASDSQLEILFHLKMGLKYVNNVLDGSVHVKIPSDFLEKATFDLAQIENVIKFAQQKLRLSVDYHDLPVLPALSRDF